MTLRKIMECSSILLLSLTMINFNAIAAKKSDRATEPATAKMPKVEICHQDQDTGLFHAINISQKAADKHLANHGDAYPETQFADGDGDGYGNEFASDVACPTPGFVTDNTDCEDNNFDINPGVDEIPGDGLDNDCDIDTDDEFHSCQGLLNAGYNTDGVYTLLPEGAAGAAMDVYCDMTTDGGGWAVIQRRMNQDTQEDFYRTWADYEAGFGDIENEFWLGNSNIHLLSQTGPLSLRIDMLDWEGNPGYAAYSSFSLGDAASNYTLNVSGFSGDSGDALSYHSGFQFSTNDNDNDAYEYGNCSHFYLGGWWYGRCHQSNLNGFYFEDGPHPSYANGVNWVFWPNIPPSPYPNHGYYYSLNFVEMKVRPASP